MTVSTVSFMVNLCYSSSGNRLHAVLQAVVQGEASLARRSPARNRPAYGVAARKRPA